MVHLLGRARALALLLSILLAVAALGPAPAAVAADTASISGRITNTAAAGVSDVWVTVYRDDGTGTFEWHRSVEPNSSGNYSVSSLPAGTYRIGFDPWSGALGPEFYDNAPSLATATDIEVDEGEVVVDRNVTLDPAAHITGTVTGAGIPLPDVEVDAYADHDGDGDWNWVADDTTAFDGSYDVDGLPEGTYRLHFYEYSGDFVDEWYDNKVDIATADGVMVAKSATLSLSSVDLTETSHIAGTVTGPGGAPAAGIEVTVYELVGGSWAWTGWDETGPSGEYDAGGLTAGTYRVGFRDWDGQFAPEFYLDKETLAAADPVTVGVAATTSGINATLANASHITGRLTRPSGAGVVDGEVEVYRLEAGVFEWFDSAYTDGAGFYDAGGLVAGTYRVGFYDWDTGTGEYWNDKGSLATADNILVTTTGQVVGNINAVLGTSPPVQVVRNLSLPAIAGTARVGQTLTATPGTWSPAGVTLTYQWYAGSTATGLTGPTYVIKPGDEGMHIVVRVIASFPGWSSAFATSPSTTLVLGDDVANTTLPKIKGKAKVGRTVRVTAGAWQPRTVALKYQWYAGSKKIRKATKKKLTITAKQAGKRLTVKVTASAPEFKSLTVRTKPSAKVKR
jgi:5-hydroxyisourate hydrolase-like protein (transthyretin family)